MASRYQTDTATNPAPDRHLIACSVNGCDMETVARGYCSSHYAKWWRYGDPTHVFERPKVTRTGMVPRRYV